MCKKTKGLHNRIDFCMKPLIEWLNSDIISYEVVACCCGHGKYPMTVVVKGKDIIGNKSYYLELLSKIKIPRTRKFYKKDKQGYYFIPEVQNDRIK